MYNHVLYNWKEAWFINHTMSLNTDVNNNARGSGSSESANWRTNHICGDRLKINMTCEHYIKWVCYAIGDGWHTVFGPSVDPFVRLSVRMSVRMSVSPSHRFG